jgi:GDPmannose 4,6-dehydratase
MTSTRLFSVRTAGRCHFWRTVGGQTSTYHGITGQDGSYLAELLLSKGYEVIGLIRRSSTLTIERISHIQDQITLVSGDLVDEVSLINVLRDYRPSEVYNLAAQSFVQTSWTQPVLTGEITALGVTRMLDAIRIVDPEIRFYQASSSEMFGRVRTVPQNEETAVLPTQSLRRREGVRPLDHRELPRELRPARVIGDPLQPRVAAARTRVRHAKGHPRRRAHQGRTRQFDLHLGNLDAHRDWGYAADYVRAMWAMLQRDVPDDFVVATGQTHSVRELCEVAFNAAGLNYEDHVVVDPAFIRPAEVDLLSVTPPRRTSSWAGSAKSTSTA